MPEPTLVLIHGICCHGKDWDAQVADFSQTMNVIAPTLPGHGSDLTPPENLTIEHLAAGLSKQLGDASPEGFILCGHSLGCRVVLEFAAQAPEAVRGLILVDGSNTVQGDMAETLSSFEEISDIHVWFQGLFDEMFRPGSFPAEQAMYRDRIAEMSGETLRALYRNMIRWDGTKLTSSLRKVAHIPLLALQSTDRASNGSRRSLEPGESSIYLDIIEAAHSNSQIITYPNHGHFPHFEAPQMFAKDVLGWIAKSALTTKAGKPNV